MQLDVITTPERLASLKEDWTDLYARDEEAQYFLSWEFMSTFLRRFDGAWFILATRQSGPRSPYAALLPLRLRTRMNAQSGRFYNEVNMGGSYTADYTGVLCPSEFVDRAFPMLVRHLKKMHWTRLHLENLRMSDRRAAIFMRELQDDRLAIVPQSRVNKRDNVDNSLCPAVDLPESWQAFLEQKLSSNTRQKLRRFLRKVEGSDEFRIGVADGSTVERDIEVLLEMWRIRWAHRKGKDGPMIERSNRLLLRQAFAAGSLFMPVLWHGQRPLGALASFIDPAKRTMHFMMAGRDETADAVPPGLVLHGYSIRHAIDIGLRRYDMMRGNEPYKYSLGATDTRIRTSLVRTLTGRNLGDRLDPRCLGGVLRQAGKFHEQNQLVRAENAYRQILATDARHPGTLYGLGQLLAGKGDHRGAMEIFRALSDIAPKSSKAWYRLGQALQGLGHAAEAAEALQRSVDLNPGAAAAKYALGLCQLELMRGEQAARSFASLLETRPADPADGLLRAKAREQLRRLKRHENPLFVRPPAKPRDKALVLARAMPSAAPASLHSSVSPLLIAAR